MKEFIYKHFKTCLTIFSILSLASVTSFWWLSLFSITFFIWNFFNDKIKLNICVTFLLLTVLLIGFNFTVIKPTQRWGDKYQAEWNRTGYDSTYLVNSQESIDIINLSIEEYKTKYGEYPNTLYEIKDIFIDNHDYTYRIKETDSKVTGISFYYEKIDSNKFFLAGVGKDGLIRTNDDLIPQISPEQQEKSGLIKYRIKSFTHEELERRRRLITIDKVTNAFLKGEEKMTSKNKSNK